MINENNGWISRMSATIHSAIDAAKRPVSQSMARASLFRKMRKTLDLARAKGNGTTSLHVRIDDLDVVISQHEAFDSIEVYSKGHAVARWRDRSRIHGDRAGECCVKTRPEFSYRLVKPFLVHDDLLRAVVPAKDATEHASTGKRVAQGDRARSP